VTGGNAERAAGLLSALHDHGVTTSILHIHSEPTIAEVWQGVELARLIGCNVVIGFGGGSPLDAAKAIAAFVTNPGDPLDYLEIIGKHQPLTVPTLPFIAIPTTAGTGSEVTRNAVLLSPEHHVKVSLRSPLMLPRLALVDPELTYSMPPDITASTGMDALTQLIEPFTCNIPNPITDALCREGIARAARSLRQAYEKGDDSAAREDMCIASVLGGIALTNAKLGVVHGIAGPLGGMFPIPHGVACAAMLPAAMAVNVKLLRARDPENDTLHRYDEVARLVTGSEKAKAEDGVKWVSELCVALKIPAMASYGITDASFPELTEKSINANSTKGNGVALNREDITEILELTLNR
jgi:alcohol dehydrogenase class IV